MADNIQLNNGSGGAVIATDDISSVHYQIIKLAYGALNSATIVTQSAPLPVDIRAENASVTVDNAGTFAVQVDGDALTALQLIDNIVQAEDAQHGSGDAGIMLLGVRNDSLASTFAGTDGDYSPIATDVRGRVWVSSDKNEDSAHANGEAGSFMLAVRNDTLGSLVGTDGDYAPFQVNASGALYIQEGTALDVSAATVPVDLGTNNDVTVTSGSITANAGTNLNTSALLTSTNFAAAFGTAGSADSQVMSIQGIASMTPVLVDATGQGDVPITLDSEAVVLGAGTAEIGSLLPPDTDVTAHSNYARKYYTATTPTDGIIWSPAAGKRWHVSWITINVSAASTVTLEDDKSGGDDPVYKAEFAANSGIFMTFPDQYPMASGEDAADLTVTASAGTVYVSCGGYEV